MRWWRAEGKGCISPVRTPHSTFTGGIRVHTGAYGCIRVHTGAYGCIRVHTGAYGCIRVHVSTRPPPAIQTYRIKRSSAQATTPTTISIAECEKANPMTPRANRTWAMYLQGVWDYNLNVAGPWSQLRVWKCRVAIVLKLCETGLGVRTKPSTRTRLNGPSVEEPSAQVREC